MAQSLTEQFKAFVASKPADEEYDYTACDGCALYQFLEAAGYPVAGVGGGEWRDRDNQYHHFPNGLGAALVSLPHAFGALHQRLEAL